MVGFFHSESVESQARNFTARFLTSCSFVPIVVKLI
jgi:hypothetical protein